jgi:hypothetical protein
LISNRHSDGTRLMFCCHAFRFRYPCGFSLCAIDGLRGTDNARLPAQVRAIETLTPEKPEAQMSEEERAEALSLLRDPKLLDRILGTLRSVRHGWARRPISWSVI